MNQITSEDIMFAIGAVYHRQSDIHKKFGGNPQSGISPSAKRKVVFLFTSPLGELHGYQDNWITPTTFEYTGKGQYGDMELKRGNRAIQKHKLQGRALHLFVKTEPGYYEYLGEFEYKSHRYAPGEDTDHEERRMIIFTLEQL